MEDTLENNLARQACAACKRQKRKCTRELPACQLCRKSRRPCDYPTETSSTSYVGDSSVVSCLIWEQGHGPVRNLYCGFTVLGCCIIKSAASSLNNWLGCAKQIPNENVALFFLDCYTFGRRQLSAEPKPGSIPGDLLAALEDGDRLHADVGRYFETIHRFFPIGKWCLISGFYNADSVSIVSKLRFQRLLLNESEPNLDTVLMFLTLRLLCCDDRSEAASLYAKCRKCLLLAETTGCASVRLLQASILITLYELANAIYPAAYLGVGRCARLGYAMGIHDRRNATQMFSPPGKHRCCNALCSTSHQAWQVLGLKWKNWEERGGRFWSWIGKMSHNYATFSGVKHATDIELATWASTADRSHARMQNQRISFPWMKNYGTQGWVLRRHLWTG